MFGMIKRLFTLPCFGTPFVTRGTQSRSSVTSSPLEFRFFLHIRVPTFGTLPRHPLLPPTSDCLPHGSSSMYDTACSRVISSSFRWLLFCQTLQAGRSSRRKLHFSTSSCSSAPRNPVTSPLVRFNLVQPHLHYDPDMGGKVRRVPAHIAAPPYAASGHVGPARKQTNLDSLPRINGVRHACKLARKTLNYLGSQLKVGLTTEELDDMAFNFIVEHKAYPSPLRYMNYPKSICTSVNNVACHGMPDKRPLMDGDILNVDVSVFIGGYHGDCSETFAVGENIDEEAVRLMATAKTALYEAIRLCRDGRPCADIGETIETIADEAGFSVVPIFCGHGIGEDFHMKPDIIHVANDETAVMKAGMIFTIEPVLSEGSDQVEIQKTDGWTAVSVDNSRSAQFEETILITKTGAEILTAL